MSEIKNGGLGVSGAEYSKCNHMMTLGLALSPECQSARMSEIKNGGLDVYGAEYSKCNHMMTLGFKGLNCLTSLLFL